MRRIFALLSLALFATGLTAAGPGTTRVPLADGFDYPVGKPDGEGYYVYRGYRPNGHLGEDWNGKGGGNSDLGDPVYAMGHGLVVLSRDARKGWGNCVIVRHAYLEPTTGKVEYVDALYAHLDFVSVKEGQRVRRGDQLGGIGTNRGMYTAHLHLELRTNLSIGMSRMQFARDNSNYLNPRHFVQSHRKLARGGKLVQVPVNTFTQDPPHAPPSKVRAGTPTRDRSDRASESGESSGLRALFNR